MNLLSNAIKYNQTDGTVLITCAPGNEGRIRISVQDSGAGLSPEKLAQLFQPFNRLGQEQGDIEGTVRRELELQAQARVVAAAPPAAAAACR